MDKQVATAPKTTSGPVELPGRKKKLAVKRSRGGLWFTIIVAVVAIGLAAIAMQGLVSRNQHSRDLAASLKQQESGGVVVNTVSARHVSGATNLNLQGNIEAVQETSIGARTSGYLKKWYVDIGDRVKANQLLAEIDTPEVDEQLRQARAQLVQAEAALGQQQALLAQAQTNMELARINLKRSKQLSEQGVVSQSDTDTTQAAYDVQVANVNAAKANINASQANIAANEANVKRLLDMEDWKKVLAPFGGVITARTVDVGSLISVGSSNASSATASSGSTSSSSSSGSLFRLARIDTLRIFVNVPQSYVAGIKAGQSVEINVREYPQGGVEGKVIRTSSSLDASTRTLLTEIHLDNRKFTLLPGMFALVKFNVTRSGQPLVVPANTIIVNAAGSQVAIVQPDQKVHLQKVVLGQDFGTEVEIISGVTEQDRLISNPSDSLKEGAVVQPVTAQP